MPEQTVSRNAPCPCGSGRKFKQCHGSPIRYRLMNPVAFVMGLLLLFALVLAVALKNGDAEKGRMEAPAQRVTRYGIVPGLDLQGLSSEMQTRLVNHLNHTPCTCDCKMTVAECRNVDTACKHSREIAEANLRELVGEGRPLSENMLRPAH